MENGLIIVLVLILLVGWILYFFRDSIKSTYNKSSGGVKEDVSHGAKVIKEEISHGAKVIKEDISHSVKKT